MTRTILFVSCVALLAMTHCSSESSNSAGTGGSAGTAGSGSGATGGSAGTTSTGGSAGTTATGGSAGTTATGGSAGTTASGGAGGSAGDGGAAPPYDDVKAWIDAYKAAHPGNGGKDWDINAKTPAQVAADPDAQKLLALCGPDQRPVIPLLAWEYGGADHQWINPQASALVYCVYIPVAPSTSNWAYDATADHVTADVWVLYPDQNPCKDQVGAAQVVACIGDATNFEILVDTASLHDGADAGLSLSNASTELMLILTDGTKVHLFAAT